MSCLHGVELCCAQLDVLPPRLIGLIFSFPRMPLRRIVIALRPRIPEIFVVWLDRVFGVSHASLNIFPSIIYMRFCYNLGILLLDTSGFDQPLGPSPDDSGSWLKPEVGRWWKVLEMLVQVVVEGFCWMYGPWR